MWKDVFHTVSSNEAQQVQNTQRNCLKFDRNEFMALFDPQVDEVIALIQSQLDALAAAHPYKQAASILVLINNAYNLIL